MYKVDELCEYIPTVVQNFKVIEPHVQLYLAEIVSGVDYLYKNNLFLRQVIPAMKKNGHLQFIAAAPDRGDFIWQSYFGYAPELLDNKKLKQKLKRADFYFLGVFLLQVALGKDLVPSKDQLARVSVPDHLPTTLRSLLFSLLEENEALRPKNIAAVKRSAYFDGIQWHKMAKQDWESKFKPSL